MSRVPCPKHINLLAIFFLCIGLSQIVGFAFNIRALKGIGFASAIAPFPKVFSDVDGLETFASEFTLLLTNSNSEVSEVVISPELYSQIPGPYNRRNVYGAALSYAPRLDERIWKKVFCYAFYNPGVLRESLKISADVRHVAVRIKTNTKGRSDHWLLDPAC